LAKTNGVKTVDENEKSQESECWQHESSKVGKEGNKNNMTAGTFGKTGLALTANQQSDFD
jgi:hypothetical protein